MAPVVRNLSANAGDTGVVDSNLGLGRSLRAGNATHSSIVSSVENSMDKRSLAGKSPQGRKESDTTEHAYMEFYLSQLNIVSISNTICWQKNIIHPCIYAEIHQLTNDTEIFCFFSIIYERIVGFKLCFCNLNKVNYSDVLNILLISVE